MRVSFVVVLFVCLAEARAGDESPKPFGQGPRVPLTTSRVVGSPDPPLPLRAVPAFTKLKFQHPLYLIAEPGTDRLLVIEQKGRIVGFANDAQVETAEEFLKLDDRDFYGMTFHPNYAENRFVFLFSNGPNSAKVKQNRLSRFTVETLGGKCLPETEQIIIEWTSNGHNGGDLAFGSDGMLYASAGDGTSDSDTDLTGQKISDLVSGMLRIDVEHPDPGKGYAVPKDNPFLNIPDARPELWAYGFRNPWRIHFDPQGNLWCGDIGQDQWEMVHVVKRGDNYGWSVLEGGHPFYLERTPGPTPFTKPTIVHPHSEARSITGGVTYHGSKFPDLKGAYIYGDYGTGKIWAARYDGQKVTFHKEIADSPLAPVGFGIDRAGEIYLVDYNSHGIYGFEAVPTEPDRPAFPRKLSETGLFLSVPEYRVQPAVIPYSVNSPLWSDGAHKDRHIALPELTQIDFTAGNWKFPERTVLMKTFSLGNDPASRKRIETRLLVYQQNEWVGYTYRWNKEQTDAELVEASGQDLAAVEVQALCGESLSWRLPSRAECMVCHSRAAVYVLGVTTPQMNRTHDYGGGVVENQLSLLARLGVLKDPGAKGTPELSKPADQFPKLPDPYDASSGDLTARVRSYLHANCAQCHVEAGGGNAAMELGFNTPLDKTRIIDVPPLHDKFQLPEARIVAPGAPERSTLAHRISLRGRGQMPPLATTRVDEDAVKLIQEWVRSLK